MKTLTKIGLLLMVIVLASAFLSSCTAGNAAQYHAHKFTGTARF